jgi:hypothetical protein
MRPQWILALLIAGCSLMPQHLQLSPAVAPTPAPISTPTTIRVEISGNVCAVPLVPTIEASSLPPAPPPVMYHHCPEWAACLSAEELAAVSSLKQDDDYLRAHLGEKHTHRHAKGR